MIEAHNSAATPISTAATRDLCQILLPDSGYLQEKEAEFANRHGFSKHRPAQPLYTQSDAERALEQFRPVPFDIKQDVTPEVSARFLPRPRSLSKGDHLSQRHGDRRGESCTISSTSRPMPAIPFCFRAFRPEARAAPP